MHKRDVRRIARARASRPRRRRIPRASASSASGRSATSWRATCRARRDRWRRRTATWSASTRGLRITRWASARDCASAARADGTDAPWFVAGKDLARNALVAVQGHDHPLLYRRDVDAIDMHWIAGAPPALPRALGAKTRYRMPDAACTWRPRRDGWRATFDAPQWAPTPGQYLVLYDGDVCLGGGVIYAAPTEAERLRSPSAAGPRDRALGSPSQCVTRASVTPARAPQRPVWLEIVRTECRRRSRRRSSCPAGGLGAHRRRLPPPPSRRAPPLAAAGEFGVTAAAAFAFRLPISCMRSPTISVEYFSTPSLSVYLRVCRRPSI